MESGHAEVHELVPPPGVTNLPTDGDVRAVSRGSLTTCLHSETTSLGQPVASGFSPATHCHFVGEEETIRRGRGLPGFPSIGCPRASVETSAQSLNSSRSAAHSRNLARRASPSCRPCL